MFEKRDISSKTNNDSFVWLPYQTARRACCGGRVRMHNDKLTCNFILHHDTQTWLELQWISVSTSIARGMLKHSAASSAGWRGYMRENTLPTIRRARPTALNARPGGRPVDHAYSGRLWEAATRVVCLWGCMHKRAAACRGTPPPHNRKQYLQITRCQLTFKAICKYLPASYWNTRQVEFEVWVGRAAGSGPCRHRGPEWHFPPTFSTPHSICPLLSRLNDSGSCSVPLYFCHFSWRTAL